MNVVQDWSNIKKKNKKKTLHLLKKKLILKAVKESLGKDL